MRHKKYVATSREAMCSVSGEMRYERRSSSVRVKLRPPIVVKVSWTGGGMPSYFDPVGAVEMTTLTVKLTSLGASLAAVARASSLARACSISAKTRFCSLVQCVSPGGGLSKVYSSSERSGVASRQSRWMRL